MAKRQPHQQAAQGKKTQPKTVAHKQNESARRAPGGARPYLLPGLLAAALGFILYANTFGHNFALDDYGAIQDNWVVKGGLKNIGTIFSTEYRFGSWNSPGNLYRPMSLTMFSVEWGLGGGKPFLFHFVNVLFYALSGWLLWITWRRILAAYPAVLTALAVLLFMAHPVHTEVVANIKSRDEIMSLLLCTVALYAIWRYFEQEKTIWLIAALLSYTIALFFKESTVTFLAVFPLTIWFFSDQPLSKNLRISAMFLVPSLIFLLVRKSVLDAQQFQAAQEFSVLDTFIAGAKSRGEALASAFMMCGYYLKTLIFPHPLVSEMGYPQLKPVSFADWRAIGGFLVYVGMGVWALMNLAKKHFLAYAILLYLATFSIAANIIMPIGTSYGERLLYAPSLGFAMAVAWAIVRLLKADATGPEANTDHAAAVWNPAGKGAALWGIAGVLVAALGLKTILRNGAWKDSYTLYDTDIKTVPNSAKLNYHYALEMTKKGQDEKTGAVTDKAQVQKGIEQYNKALSLYPDYHDAFGSRGLAYYRLEQDMKAMSDFKKTLSYRHNDSKVLSNMGTIYWKWSQLRPDSIFRRIYPGVQLPPALSKDQAEGLQRFINVNADSAAISFRKAVEFDPRFSDARRNLGVVLVTRKDFDGAIAQWQEGLKYEPNDAVLHLYIGSAYRDSGRPDKAAPWLEKAYQLNPALKK